MIDLNELKKLADATYDTSLTVNEYRDAFDALMENVDAEVVCKLLAIQAQLVTTLESIFKIQVENYGDGISTHINLMSLTTKVQDALFSAGALK